MQHLHRTGVDGPLTSGTTGSVVLSDGVALRVWTTTGSDPEARPIVMLHGGPGLPDYLAPVATMITTATVHRFDQRGVGGSVWDGEHTVARHVADVIELVDHLDHDQVVLLGHSYGTDLACHVLLAHPDRVAGMIMLAGPMTEPWREACRAAERSRRTAEQQARFEELDGRAERDEAEEIEFLTLAWFTDHADRARAWGWAAEDAAVMRPVNLIMNAQLNADKKRVALEDRLDDLRRVWPTGSVIIGGEGDPRPAAALRRIGARLDCPTMIIPGAGHSPWRERPETVARLLGEAVERLS